MYHRDERPKSYVLIPNEQHAHLLRGGVGGSRPPVAFQAQGKSSWTLDRPRVGVAFMEALVLQWEGKPAEAGLDALFRAEHLPPNGAYLPIFNAPLWWTKFGLVESF